MTEVAVKLILIVPRYMKSASAKHFFRQVGRLLGGHARKIDRHRQRGQLVLRHLAVQRAIDDVANLLLGKFAAVALLFDQEVERGLDETPGRDVSFAGHGR